MKNDIKNSSKQIFLSRNYVFFKYFYYRIYKNCPSCLKWEMSASLDIITVPASSRFDY